MSNLSIAAVERDTGLAKETLRVWERRYGFPSPQRDELGERVYDACEVDKLRAIRRLVDLGHRPGRLVSLPLDELLRMAEKLQAQSPVLAKASAQGLDELRRYLELVKANDVDGLRRGLMASIEMLGIQRFVHEVAAPLTTLVGDAWMRGEIEVFDEHIYTECMSNLLHVALGLVARGSPTYRPKVLLTTLPQEAHGLGLLMAECVLSLQGAQCMSMGTQTPLLDIVKAARKHQVDVVGLSFSVAMKHNQVVQGLEELRQLLPATTEIWAGGHSLALQRREVAGVLVVSELEQIKAQLQRWRLTHG